MHNDLAARQVRIALVYCSVFTVFFWLKYGAGSNMAVTEPKSLGKFQVFLKVSESLESSVKLQVKEMFGNVFGLELVLWC